jgi:hypothetical protein
MEAAPSGRETSFEQVSGQGTTDSSPTLTHSSIESVHNAMFESPPLEEIPFQTGFDTPQSSVFNMMVRQGLQQGRVARFMECACVSGGACVGTAGQTTCGCGSSPEMAQVQREAKTRSIKKLAKTVTKCLKRIWNRQIQAIKNRVGRGQRQGPGAGE